MLSTWMGICRGNHEGLGVGFSNQKCMYCLPGGVTCILGNRSKDPLIPSNPKQQPVITFFNSRTEKLLIHSRKFLIFRIQDQNNRTLMYDTSVYVILKYIYIYIYHICHVCNHCWVHPCISKPFRPTICATLSSRYMWADARVLPLKMMQELSRHNPVRWSKFKSPGELADELDALDSMRKLD